MPRRIRQHVNALSLGHLRAVVEPVPLPPDLPVEVELGCADAAFLFERCESDPDRFYVGVEIRREMVDRVNRRAAERRMPQVVAVYGNLLVDLGGLFPPASVTLCHINFPDPFFKKSQHKRRFLTPGLLDSLAGILRPGGLLSFQSDVFEVALEALDLLERSAPLFMNDEVPWRFVRRNLFGARSRRERGCEAKGLRIWRLRFRRALAPGSDAASSAPATPPARAGECGP